MMSLGVALSWLVYGQNRYLRGDWNYFDAFFGGGIRLFFMSEITRSSNLSLPLTLLAELNLTNHSEVI